MDESLVELEQVRRDALTHPAALIREMRAWDERETEGFQFNLDHPDGRWGWQGEYLSFLWEHLRTISLKARQLGVTWIVAALAVWFLLYRPGSLVLVYRQKEDESAEVILRMWVLLNSLPKHLWNGAKVVKPVRGKPYVDIELKFPDGKMSRARGMSSSESSGHGSTAAFTIFDEHAWNKMAKAAMKAGSAAVGAIGRMAVVSTANGRHNEETGEGNHFHYLWTNAAVASLATRFLGYFRHPDRPLGWRETAPEALALPLHERLEQYPENEEEAFTYSRSVFFDTDALLHYAAERTAEPLYRATFIVAPDGRSAKLVRKDEGIISVFEEPVPDREYAIGADVASGDGLDWSAAYVVDLETMAFAAEIRCKIDADLYAAQLHFLGKMYNTALIAVEDAGGWGSTVTMMLRLGKEGRPPYPNAYRHRQDLRVDRALQRSFGYPMNIKTRPLVLSRLEQAIRERLLPRMPPKLLEECGNFVHRETNPTPAAADGCHDDCVMSAAITLELYQQRGHHPNQYKPEKKTQLGRLNPRRLSKWDAARYPA